jgi:hypothetical protein
MMPIPRKRFIVLSALFFFFALFIAKFTKLLLTAPLLLVGLALVGLGVAITKNDWRKIALYNAGLLSILASAIFSALNIVNFAKGEDARILMSEDSVYGRLPVQVSGPDEPLGYRYKENTRNVKSHKLATDGEKTVTVYNVVYNINKHGNRLNPFPVSIKADSNSILFLGDSLTFGEGLQDDQTLSYYYSELSGNHTINAGMHGYGTHQALKIVSDPSILKERSEGKKISTVIYTPILNHINRSAGYSPWDSHGPCYEISEQDNRLYYKGSFRDCKPQPLLGRFLKRFLGYMSASSEPWTRNIGNSLFRSKYATTNYSRDDYERFVSIIREMQKTSDRNEMQLFLLINDLGAPPKCERSPFSDHLKKEGIDFVRAFDILSASKCKTWSYHISEHDKHPTALQNKELAKHLNSILSP